MKEILDSISSPAWIFSTVLVALLVNIVSAYLKSPIDRFLSKVNTAWRNRTAKLKSERAERIRVIRASSDLQMILLLEALTYRGRSIRWLLIAAFMGLFLLAYLQIRLTAIVASVPDNLLENSWLSPAYVATSLGLIAIFLSLSNNSYAYDREELVKAARHEVIDAL